MLRSGECSPVSGTCGLLNPYGVAELQLWHESLLLLSFLFPFTIIFLLPVMVVLPVCHLSAGGRPFHCSCWKESSQGTQDRNLFAWDVSAVLVRLLCDASGHAGRTLPVCVIIRYWRNELLPGTAGCGAVLLKMHAAKAACA